MTNILKLFNPCSDHYHAIKDFGHLSNNKKKLTICISIITGLFSLGIGVVPVFRLLVKKWTVIKPQSQDLEIKPTSNKVHQIIEEKKDIFPNGVRKQKENEALPDQEAIVEKKQVVESPKKIANNEEQKEILKLQKGEELQKQKLVTRPRVWHKQPFKQHDYDWWKSEEEKKAIEEISKFTTYPKLAILIHTYWPHHTNWPNHQGKSFNSLRQIAQHIGDQEKERGLYGRNLTPNDFGINEDLPAIVDGVIQNPAN